MDSKTTRVSIYRGDEIRPRLKDYKPFGQPVPYGSDVKGVFFDGYPQITKQEGSKPAYSVKVEKDIMIPMRDGISLFTIIYSPKDKSQKYPILLYRTPYSISPYGPNKYRSRLGPSQEFDEDGYIFVFQDVRGKFKSEGKAYVRAGQQAPGFEIVLFISAIIVAFVLFRRRNHN